MKVRICKCCKQEYDIDNCRCRGWCETCGKCAEHCDHESTEKPPPEEVGLWARTPDLISGAVPKPEPEPMSRNSSDNGYLAFWRGKKIEVYAPSSYAAQQKAAAEFKAKKAYEVTVVLCERADGSTVTHSTAEI